MLLLIIRSSSRRARRRATPGREIQPFVVHFIPMSQWHEASSNRPVDKIRTIALLLTTARIVICQTSSRHALGQQGEHHQLESAHTTRERLIHYAL